MSRTFPKITVTEKGEKMLRGGHVWVYADEVVSLTEAPENGALADVYSKKDKYLGTGFYNENSKIRVRIVSKNANDKFDQSFWERKLRWALDYRRSVMGERDFSCCRLIFGEADAFPGLTIDRFGNILVTQVLSLGIEHIKDMLYSITVKLLREDFGQKIDALYERNDVAIRALEGMEQYTAFWKGEELADALDGKPRSPKTGSATRWTISTDKRRDSSSTKNITVPPSARSPMVGVCWIALHIRDLLD